MPRRAILTDRQRSALLDLPTDEPSLSEGITPWLTMIWNTSPGAGAPKTALVSPFSFVSCATPVACCSPGELIPSEVVAFIAVQLGIAVESLLPYAARRARRDRNT